MLNIRENVSLRQLNTFGVEASARYYLEIPDPELLPEFFSDFHYTEPLLILGGGSNILFTRNFDGLVLRMMNTGVRVLQEEGQEVVLLAGAGLVWDDFVAWALEQGYYGLENLSLIPGCVGAVPVQNVGAYGFEAGDAIVGVEGFDLKTGEMLLIDHETCHFSYRSSIFKEKLSDSFLITAVVFRLSRKPVVNLSYEPLARAAKNIDHPAPEDVRNLVLDIRKKKLPDPKAFGNGGSFFKNPVVQKDYAENLISDFPEMPLFQAGENLVKIPAGWLVEQCGWKGKQQGRVGVWHNQALVIINRGGASGSEIFDLSESIRLDVQKKFGITLEREVRVI